MSSRPIRVGIEAPTRQFGKDLDRSARDLERFGKRGSASFKKLAVAGAAAGVAMGAFMVDAGRQFAELDKEVREVATLIPGATEDIVTGIRKDTLNLSKEFGIAGTEIADAFYDSVSAGIAREDTPDFLRDAGKLAVAGNAEISASTDLLTSAINAFNLEASDSGRVSDIFFGVVKSGKTTIDELGAAFSNVGPVAAAANLDLEETTAWLAQLTLSGTPTKEAATQVRAALSELGKGGSVAFKAFEQAAGVTFPQFIEEGGTMSEAIKEMAAYAEETGTPITDMFGSIEAGQAMLGVTGEKMEGFDQVLFDLANSAGSTEEAFQLMSQGFDFQAGRLKETFRAAQVNIASVFMPQLAKVLPHITEMVDKVATADIAGFFTKFKDRIDRDVTPRVLQIRRRFEDWWGNVRKTTEAAKLLGAELIETGKVKFDQLKEFVELKAEDLRKTVKIHWTTTGEPWSQETLDNIQTTLTDFWDNQLPTPVKEAIGRFGESVRGDWEAALKIPDLVTEAWQAAQEGDFATAAGLMAQAWAAAWDLTHFFDNFIFMATGKTVPEWAAEWIPGVSEGIKAAADEEDWTSKFTVFMSAMFTEIKREWDETWYPKIRDEIWPTITGWFASDGAVTRAWNTIVGWLGRVFTLENLLTLAEWGGKVSTELFEKFLDWWNENDGSAAGTDISYWIGKAVGYVVLGLPVLAARMLGAFSKEIGDWLREEQNRERLGTFFYNAAHAWFEHAKSAISGVMRVVIWELPNKIMEWTRAEDFAAAGESWAHTLAAPFVRIITNSINAVIDDLNEAVGWINRVNPFADIPDIPRLSTVKWAQTLPQQQLAERESLLHNPLGNGNTNTPTDFSTYGDPAYRFAEGGIVTRPTMGLVGEEGPEAVIPLDQMSGMGSPVFNITINTTGGVDIDEIQDAIRERVRLEGPDGFAGALIGA